jgi:transcriptional regulator with XRE-family HTH domain
MGDKLYTFSFKEGFKRARKKSGYTQKSFSEEFNISIETVKNWEQGRNVPEIETLEKLCNFFHCDIDYLLGNMECETHDKQFIHDKTGLSEDAINVLKEWNRISKEKGPQYTWARNSLQALNDLLSQGVIVANNILLPIAEYIVYRSEYETMGRKKINLDKYRLALFTASNGLSECIKNIYHATHPKPKKKHPAQ